ncbi:hypothetical protein STZ1_11105 [Bacillus subtilis]
MAHHREFNEEKSIGDHYESVLGEHSGELKREINGEQTALTFILFRIG